MASTNKQKEYDAKKYLMHREDILERNRIWRAESNYAGPTSATNSFRRMSERCRNPKHNKFKWYGGRGITVCERWQGLGGFRRFVADMGPRPSPSHQLHRLDNDGNYEPGNVVWSVDHSETK